MSFFRFSVVEESASVQRAIGLSEGVDGKDRQKTEGVSEKVKKLKEAASVLPSLDEGVYRGGEKTGGKQGSKICDALGACKEKLSEAFGAAKEKVTDVHDKISGKVADVEASAMEAARKAVHGGEEVAEKVKHASEKHMVEAVDRAKRVIDSAAVYVADGAEKIQHGASETAREVAGEAKDTYCREGGKAREAGVKVQEAAERTKGAPEEGRRNITDIIQRGGDVLYDAAMYAVSPEKVGSLMRLLHSLAFSVVYGTCFWVTFVSSHVLARALPMQQFGVVQSKIYPVYFRTVTYGIGTCLITNYLSRWASASRVGKHQALNLLLPLGFVLVNMLYIEPRATNVSSLYSKLSPLVHMDVPVHTAETVIQ